MTKPNDKMPGSLLLAWWVVAFALITAIGFAWDLAWHRFHGVMLVISGLGLMTIAIAEVLFWHKAASYWLHRRLFASLFAAAVAMACSAGTLYTNYSTSALGQDSRASEKLGAFNASDDLDKGIKEKTDRVATLQKQLAAAPTRTPEAAQAAIDNAKAHKFWTSTNSCRETRGQQTRDFCAQYASAVADKSNSSAAIQARADLANEQAALDGLRKQRGSSETVASKDNPALSLWASAGLNDRESQVADAMMMPTVIQVILMLGGILLALEHFGDKEPRSWLPAWLSGWFKSSASVALTGRQLKSADEVYEAAAAHPEPLRPAPSASTERLSVIGIKQPTLLEKWNQEQSKPAS